MNKKLLLILLALSLTTAVFVVGCSSDDNNDPTVTAPNAPTGVTATIVSPTTVRIDWTASVLDEAPNGYSIGRRTAEGDWSEIGSVGVSVTTYNDNTIDRGSGTTYLYRVGAYNDGGSTFSTTATVTVKTFNELLDGAWDALDAINQTGADSSSIIFDYSSTQGGYIYRRTDWYDSMDSEDIEEGIYSATATTITWSALRINGVAADTSYTWNYDMAASGLTMSVEYDWGETPFDVDFIYVTPPPVD
jgi:hypothetical protein